MRYKAGMSERRIVMEHTTPAVVEKPILHVEEDPTPPAPPEPDPPEPQQVNVNVNVDHKPEEEKPKED